MVSVRRIKTTFRCAQRISIEECFHTVRDLRVSYWKVPRYPPATSTSVPGHSRHNLALLCVGRLAVDAYIATGCQDGHNELFSDDS